MWSHRIRLVRLTSKLLWSGYLRIHHREMPLHIARSHEESSSCSCCMLKGLKQDWHSLYFPTAETHRTLFLPIANNNMDSLSTDLPPGISWKKTAAHSCLVRWASCHPQLDVNCPHIPWWGGGRAWEDLSWENRIGMCSRMGDYSTILLMMS